MESAVILAMVQQQKECPRILLLDYSLHLKKTVQLPDPGRMPHFAQGLCFNLPDPLACHAKLAANLF